MERTERLLDLVALLLDSQEPVSWAEMREAFPEDYASGSDDATERKFERDKAELLELGIPITYVQGDEDRKDGYVIARDAYYLPDPGFTKEEIAVLYTAGAAALASGVFPGSQDLAHALRKLGFFSGGEDLPVPRVRMELGPQQQSPKVAEHLQLLWQAAGARKSVQLDYQSPRSGGELTSRKVDPYGLALRQGIWTLVGYCHLRQGIRTFHVHRILSLQINPVKPKSPDFELPKDFDVDSYVAQFPWQHRMHAPTQVTLALRGQLAHLAERLFPDGKVDRSGRPEAAPGQDQEVRVQLEIRFLDGLVRYLLSLSPNVEVLAPELAVARFREMAGKVLSLHEGGAAQALQRQVVS